jgi:hypothetical protein
MCGIIQRAASVVILVHNGARAARFTIPSRCIAYSTVRYKVPVCSITPVQAVPYHIHTRYNISPLNSS